MNDSSGNNQTGIYDGTGVSWVTDKDGIANNCIKIINDGNDVSFPAVNFASFTDGFTISFLVYDLGESYVNNRFFIGGYTPTLEGISISFGQTYTLDPYLYVRLYDTTDTNGTNYIQAKLPYINFFVWKSITVKYDGTSNSSGISVLIDGVTQNSVNTKVGTFNSIKANTLNPNHISWTNSVTNAHLQRYSIWSKLLNANELSTLIKPYLMPPSITHTGYSYGNTTTINPNTNYAFTPNFKFYTAKTGGTLLGSGSSYTTDTLTIPTTVWVCSEYNGNESTRLPVSLYPVDVSISDADMILIADAEITGITTGWHNLSKIILSEQPIAGGTPTIIDNQLNGHKVMRFNGSTDYFDLGRNIMQVDADGLSIFIVFKSNNTSQFGLIGKSGYGALPARWWIVPKNNTIDYYYNGGGTNVPYIANVPNLMTSVYNISGNTAKLYRNSLLLTNSTITVESLNTYNLLIGAYGNPQGTVPPQPGVFLNGDIAEVIIYTTSVNDTKRTNIETYLRHKYAFWLFTVDKDVTLSGGLRGISIVEDDNIYLLSKYNSNTVEIRNLTTDALIGSALTGFENPAGIALDIANDRYYVACVGSNLVRVMQYSTHTQITTITGISACSGLVLDVHNDRIYVSGYGEGSVKVYRHSDNSYVGTIGGSMVNPTGAGIIGDKLYVPEGGKSTILIYQISTNTLLKTVETSQSLMGQVVIDATNNIYYAGSYASNPVVHKLTDDTQLEILSSASRGVGLCLRPATNSIYFARYSSNILTVLSL